MEFLIGFSFLLLSFACWLATWFGLPGNWFLVLLSALAAWIHPAGFFIPWSTVAIFAVLALVAEVGETSASMYGLTQGGSRKGATHAAIGSIVGGLIGGILGFPLPGFGSVVGALLGASLGAFAGAYWGERESGIDSSARLRLGFIAALGRFLGSLFKIAMGWVLLLSALVSFFF